MISIVTPTFRRPGEVADLLENLSRQELPPTELILVDGAPLYETDTEVLMRSTLQRLPFKCRYLRHSKGTAIQRNAGIELAQSPYIALIDDDVRLEPDFLRKMVEVFEADKTCAIGGLAGYRTSHHFNADSRRRWRWYRKLGLLKTYEPGRYDFQTGFPINANMQPPFIGVRDVDFITTACAMWRREVFESGLRFDPFFKDYGILEDAHFSLRAGRRWRLLQCGEARCRELNAPGGRADERKIGYKRVVNYYYVFQDIVRPLTWRHKCRFWRYQSFELFRSATSVIRFRRFSDVREVWGRLEGFIAVANGTAFGR